ncbi:zinc finger SWIM domain-containing protein 7-like isoform X2 [Glycine soja]|uniref:zinc finger SWIM domain-containing protein 7-like isoform X2 n=1 Tax=Glycine soja TaxID=3848 RepID=UPI00103F7932|nr:zinc finger SWIM domain-containing protein 7-like isoform X2 [Glycine soja]
MSASSLVAETIWKEIESTPTVNDDHLWSLHFLFGKNFEGATRIVDLRGVSKISAHPSGRFIFQVNPKEKTSIFVLLKTFALVIHSSMMLSTECKHQLAARLAASLGSYVEVKVSDEELAALLSKI